MKFREVKEKDVFYGEYSIIKAKKNMIQFEIRQYNENCGTYVLVRDLDTDIGFNSLWRGIYFLKIENAQKFCEDVADYYKDIRIKEGVGANGNEMANSRLDNFLNEHKEYVPIRESQIPDWIIS